jgi:AcrR family transcriptional regulator
MVRSPAVSTTPGLRERKKEQTRQAIREAALRLFAERGFDGVTVAEIAGEADVSVATVFNYFPTKEDLVYGQLEVFEAELLDAVRDREPGESVLAAFVRFVGEPRGWLVSKDPEAAERLEAITRIITSSPELIARENEIFARYAQSLAELLAAETGASASDSTPGVAAYALIGVHRTLIDQTRKEILAGTPTARLARNVRLQAKRALELLERGLQDYGTKPR